MELRIDSHTLQRAEERGASLDELRDVLATGKPASAKCGRLARENVYPFEATRLGNFYAEKLIRLIYTIDNGVAVAVTVYVFYGSWKDGR